MKRTEGNIAVGDRDVDPTAPSHVPGVHQGNWPGRARRAARARHRDPVTAGGGSRSTGINPADRAPRDPHSPKITPP